MKNDEKLFPLHSEPSKTAFPNFSATSYAELPLLLLFVLALLAATPAQAIRDNFTDLTNWGNTLCRRFEQEYRRRERWTDNPKPGLLDRKALVQIE